jgi:2-aminoadipate transaminase
MKRSFIREILEHTNSQTISFAGGLPDASLFPLEELQSSANRVLENPSSLQYSTSTGYTSLKEKIANFYNAEGFDTSPENILVTSGSQQALDIISRYYSSKPISIEAPSYLGAMNVFTLNSLKQESVKLEEDGVALEAFKKSFDDTKFAYLIPDFQNPSGVTYSQEKREEIAKIVKKNNGILIEDSPYSKLYFEEEYQSISSLAPKNSFHLGTFSKTLAPALRIGWIRADTKLIEPLIAYKEAMDLHSNGLAQQIINDYLKDETLYAKHLESLRGHYAKKMEFFSQHLDKVLPDFVYKKPKGGMFIYGRFSNIDSSELIQKCLGKEVAFVPGREFYLGDNICDEIRFNFTHSEEGNVIIGLSRIEEVLNAYVS